MLADHLAQIGVPRPPVSKVSLSNLAWRSGLLHTVAHWQLSAALLSSGLCPPPTPDGWFRGCCFHFPSVCEVIVLNGHFAQLAPRLAGFVVVDTLSHHIFPQGWRGVFVCSERGSTSSSSASSRFCYTRNVFKDAQKYRNAPDLLRGVEGDGRGVAWLHVLSDAFPPVLYSFPSMELPATTVGEWWRRHSL